MKSYFGPPGIIVNNLGPFPGKFSREQEMIDARTRVRPTKPDPKWNYTDSAGHFHAYNVESNFSIFTAEEIFVARSSGWGEDYEEWRESVGWNCILCGERIPTPKRIADMNARDYIPGRLSWSIKFENVNEPKLWGLISSQSRVSVRVPLIKGFGIGETESTGLSNEGYSFTVRGIGEFGRYE